MRKTTLIAIWAIVLAVVSIGCGNASQPAPQASSQTAAPQPQAAPAPAADVQAASDPAPTDEEEEAFVKPWTGDLDGMVERRYIRILCTFNRTNYFLDKAEQRGITYEAGKKFQDFVNDRLKMKTVKVHVAFIPVRHDRIFSALAAGEGDIAAANLTITPERRKLATFANPWISDVKEVVVLGAGQPPVLSVDDLAGREVHVRKSSSYYESLVALNEKFKAAGRKPVKIVEADEQLEEDDLLEMANAALIPITVVDSHIAAIWSQVFPNIQVVEGVTIRSGGEIAWAVRNNSPKLLEMINAFVAANAKGSATYNILFKKYYQNTKFVKNARSDEEVRRFSGTIDFFKKYGDKYDFPWLLLAAQAYQESGIDQSRVSSVGAVGIMQIKPSTAESSPVFIKGVDKSAERNVEAGTKYLRFIADQLKETEGMDRINRGLFAFASYNAGPARIAQLRKKATQRGLDPNKWFGNVELVAARDIGQETVGYVANIYKYYVSYTLISKTMEERARARGGR